LKEIQSNPDLGLQLIGFVDDNPRLRGRKIKGYPVLGGGDNLGEIIRAHDIRTIIVSFKRAGAEKTSDIKALCDRTGMTLDVRQMQVVIS
jgi:FlaA1/EpsC-like NDP-sugar epimerase